jgi:hypothetical protein
MTKLEQMVQTVNIGRIDQAKLENNKIIIDTTLGYDDIIKVHLISTLIFLNRMI